MGPSPGKAHALSRAAASGARVHRLPAGTNAHLGKFCEHACKCNMVTLWMLDDRGGLAMMTTFPMVLASSSKHSDCLKCSEQGMFEPFLPTLQSGGVTIYFSSAPSPPFPYLLLLLSPMPDTFHPSILENPSSCVCVVSRGFSVSFCVFFCVLFFFLCFCSLLPYTRQIQPQHP